MKTTIVKCDICSKDITKSDIRYKFKKYENTIYTTFRCNKWTKLDMCDECFNKLQQFVRKPGKINED